MFFNLGGYEILVIAVVALIVIGPEQLPTVMRKVGRYAAQARSMAQNMREEFMAGMGGDEGLDELRQLTRPDAWLGSGSDDDPIVPRGFADRQRAAERDKPHSAPALAPVETPPAVTAPAEVVPPSTTAPSTTAPSTTEPLPTGTGETASAGPTDTPLAAPAVADGGPGGSAAATEPPPARPAPFSGRSSAGDWARPPAGGGEAGSGSNGEQP